MYLSIDLGDKKCGLAVSIENIVVPKGVISRVKIIPEIKKLISLYNIKIIIVGLPFDMYLSDFRQLNKTNKFIKKISTIFPSIKIKTIDERFSSKIFIRNGENKQIDDMCALVILQDFLKKNNC